jgi:hypothetical protein
VIPSGSSRRQSTRELLPILGQHIIDLAAKNHIALTIGSGRGRAMRAAPSRGTSASIRVPEIKGQITYLIALHELAHALGLRYRDLGRQRAEARVWPLADRADPRALGPVGRQSSSVAASAISSHWACQSSPIVVRTSHVAPAPA